MNRPNIPPEQASHSPKIRGFPLGPFETNCYVLWHNDDPTCWIVDASYEPQEMIDFIRGDGLRPAAIVLTHAHCDHMAGIYDVLRAFPGLPVWVHEAEREWLQDPLLNLSMMTGIPATAPEASRLLREGDVLELSGQKWRVIHTPGHSPGGISLYHEPSRTAIVGDALFAGSIGRTDFPGSDHEMLVRSIQQKLYRLPPETRIYPGHGPESTIGREMKSNPFVRA